MGWNTHSPNAFWEDITPDSAHSSRKATSTFPLPVYYIAQQDWNLCTMVMVLVGPGENRGTKGVAYKAHPHPGNQQPNHDIYSSLVSVNSPPRRRATIPNLLLPCWNISSDKDLAHSLYYIAPHSMEMAEIMIMGQVTWGKTKTDPLQYSDYVGKCKRSNLIIVNPCTTGHHFQYFLWVLQDHFIQ